MLTRALEWHRKADTLQLATADYGLDLATILSTLCIQVHVETLHLNGDEFAAMEG